MSKSKIVWKDWKPKEVREAVKEKLAENMELVGVMVEQQARENLREIQWRPRFKKYRSVYLARLLTHEVEVGDDFVECRVGILNPPGTTHSKAGYKIETGTSKKPAQPWLRPAVFGLARRIVEILKG
jgi:hypothetical protein